MTGAGINAWAGLGLFFVGLRMISAHMRHFAGGGLRALLSRTLGKTAAPECAGVALGALTQSTAAVTFITSGLLASRTLPMPRALRMVSWANVGTSALVLLAAIHIHSMVLVLLGLVGFGFFMGTEQSEKYRHATYALLGLGLLLFGLTMLKDSVGVLENEPWMREFVAFAGSGILVALVSSFVVAVAVQSSSIVTVLALPLVSQDLIGLDQALLMIYGASVGSGFALLLASSGMDGDARQLSLTQAVLRGLTASVLLLAFFIERDAGVPLVLALLRFGSDTTSTQFALAYLLFQLVLVTIGMTRAQWLLSFASRTAPPSPEEAVMKPQYIFDEARSDPATAMALIELEYNRLVTLLPDFLDEVRAEEERLHSAAPLKLRAAASESIAGELDRFLSDTLRANPGMYDTETVLHVQTRLNTLQALQTALAQFAFDFIVIPQLQRPRLAEHMIEGLHAILMVAADIPADPSGESQAMLAMLTEERSSLMERVREELLGGFTDIVAREAMLAATLTFERAIWLLRRL
jgi:phosphate:Na+ symporter